MASPGYLIIIIETVNLQGRYGPMKGNQKPKLWLPGYNSDVLLKAISLPNIITSQQVSLNLDSSLS